MELVNLVLRSALEKGQVPEIKQVSDIKDVLPATLGVADLLMAPMLGL